MLGRKRDHKDEALALAELMWSERENGGVIDCAGEKSWPGAVRAQTQVNLIKEVEGPSGKHWQKAEQRHANATSSPV